VDDLENDFVRHFFSFCAFCPPFNRRTGLNYAYFHPGVNV